LPFNLGRSLNAASFLLIGYIIQTSGLMEYLKEKSNLILGILAMLLFVLFVGVYYNNSLFYDYSSIAYGTLKTFKVGIISFYIMAVSASMGLITICLILDHVKFFNWLGMNSMTILIVHASILELILYILNVAGLLKIDILPLYMCLCVMIYVCTFLLCSPFVVFFKKMLPKFTGYADLITNNSKK